MHLKIRADKEHLPDAAGTADKIGTFATNQENQLKEDSEAPFGTKFLEDKHRESLNSGTLLKQALKIPDVQSYQGQFENGIAHGIATIMFATPAETSTQS